MSDASRNTGMLPSQLDVAERTFEAVNAMKDAKFHTDRAKRALKKMGSCSSNSAAFKKLEAALEECLVQVAKQAGDTVAHYSSTYLMVNSKIAQGEPCEATR